jgi:hypothetical protein
VILLTNFLVSGKDTVIDMGQDTKLPESFICTFLADYENLSKLILIEPINDLIHLICCFA